MKLRSNLARTFWIGRLRGFGCGAAAERAGGVLPCRGIAGVWRFWGSRAQLGLELVVDVARGMRSTPMRSEQRIGVRDGVYGGGGGCARRSFAVSQCSGGSGAGARARKGPGACARTGRTCAGVVRGWGARQGTRHGEAVRSAAARRRRAVFRVRAWLRATGSSAEGRGDRVDAYRGSNSSCVAVKS